VESYTVIVPDEKVEFFEKCMTEFGFEFSVITSTEEK
jgi:hypothetical protein